MRPRKNVMLYCQCEQITSVTRFILENQVNMGFPGYRVYASATEIEITGLIQTHAQHFFDCAVVIRVSPNDESPRLCSALTAHGLKTLFMNRRGGAIDGGTVNASAFYSADIANAEWMDRLRILCARKSGPKKVEAAA